MLLLSIVRFILSVTLSIVRLSLVVSLYGIFKIRLVIFCQSFINLTLSSLVLLLLLFVDGNYLADKNLSLLFRHLRLLNQAIKLFIGSVLALVLGLRQIEMDAFLYLLLGFSQLDLLGLAFICEFL